MNERREIAGFPGYFVDADGVVWTSKLKGGNDRTPGKRGAVAPAEGAEEYEWLLPSGSRP